MADSRQQIIGEINGEIQGAVDAFNDAIPQMEKSLVRKINLIIKDLDLNPNGTIKSTIANMKKMRTIEREMAVAFESAQYLGNVEKYTNAYDKTRAIEGKYFDKVLTDYSEPAIMNEIQSQAVSTVTKELTGSNIVANVIDPVNTLVRQGIESGMEWDDLRSSIGDFLQGVDGGVGALDRYTTTITNDALNTYARTYENTIANREGIEWYEYVGREMTNTRDFCSTLDAQRWFHQSEIKGFLKGRIGKRTVPLYRKTGKPYGMKSSTTEKNFVQLAGGWNCGHHAYPVPTHLVPQKVRDKFETGVDAVDVDDALDVDDFVPAKSIKEAEQFARDNKFGQNVDFSRVDLKGANIMNERFMLAKNKYNLEELIEYNTNIPTMDAGGMANGKAIIINKNAFVEKRVGLKYNTTKHSRFAVSDSYDLPKYGTTIVDHEIGHVIADQKFGQVNGKNLLKSKLFGQTEAKAIESLKKNDQLINKFWSSPQDQKIIRAYVNNQDKIKKCNILFRKYRNQPHSKIFSEYAFYEPEEFFAESYAMWQRGEKMPTDVLSFLESIK